MIQFFGGRVWPEILKAAKATRSPAHVAVAYVGDDGDKLLPLRPGSTLVVNASVESVSAGSTSPNALLRLHRKGIHVFSARILHSKVFVFDRVAFVGSANASTNSEKHLLEAGILLSDATAVAAARAFVLTTAVTRLDEAMLLKLAKLYRPPKIPGIPPAAAPFSTLIMELTNEQGGSRKSQVQPPKPVWDTYFNVDLSAVPLPELQLTNLKDPGALPELRRISKHDHNFTIEITGYTPPPQGILELNKLGPRAFSYTVHSPGEPGHARHAKLLASVSNPLRTHGRKWLVI